jgi:hypothetical protein
MSKTRIRVHNPCNEKTKNFRYYNFFWDEFTNFLKTKFDVEENRFFENAHFEKFLVNLQKKTNDPIHMMECEYIIENLENGEFIILSVADRISDSMVKERQNPFLKKCLISQYIPKVIESNTGEYYNKFSPWTYFPYMVMDYELIRDKRKNLNNKFKKLYFRGDERGRSILNHFNREIVDINKRTYLETYFNEVINYEVGLCIGGVGEMCYRDIEFMMLEIPIIRFKYETELYPKLIPNFHYISVEPTEKMLRTNFLRLDRLGDEKEAKKIEDRFNEAISDKEFLRFISKNAREYYENNLTIDNQIKNTYILTGLKDWEKEFVNEDIQKAIKNLWC